MRDASARAGFHFALAAMWRNNTHRLTLACAAAGGFAMAVLALSNSFPEAGGAVTARLLAVQPLLFGALLVGFRHIIRVPAELRANWGFQLAWAERGDAFLSGVKARGGAGAGGAGADCRAAVVRPRAWPRTGACCTRRWGWPARSCMLEIILHRYDKVPFTCTYVPSENMKALAPIYAIAFVIGVSTLGAAAARGAARRFGGPCCCCCWRCCSPSCGSIDARRPRVSLVDFDEAPPSYQGLNLRS